MGVKFWGSGERFILPAIAEPAKALALALDDAGFRFRRLFGWRFISATTVWNV